MSGVNKVILIGNLGQDPDVRYLDSGDAVANVSIATSETWKDKASGERQERTEWHRVVFFGKVADVVEQYLRKGSKIYVEGKLRTRKWQDKEGTDRYATEVVVDMGGTMQMLDGKQGGRDTDFGHGSDAANAPNGSRGAKPTREEPPGSPGGDIPF